MQLNDYLFIAAILVYYAAGRLWFRRHDFSGTARITKIHLFQWWLIVAFVLWCFEVKLPKKGQALRDCEEIVTLAKLDSSKLTLWERKFVADIGQRLDTHAELVLSEKQQDALAKIATKLGPNVGFRAALEFKPASESPPYPDGYPGDYMYVLLNKCDGYHVAFADFDDETKAFESFIDFNCVTYYPADDFYVAWAVLPDVDAVCAAVGV